MQRVTALVVLLVSLLYLALLDAGNRTARAQETAKPSAPEDAQALETAPQPTGSPHIAVLLPTESSAFGRAADAVRQGVLEAYRVQPAALPIIVYATGDDPNNVAKRYRSAVDAQARVVIGPLTRSAVTTLVQSNAATVPTLALNSADAASASRTLYFFGMQTENEARQMAELAATQGHKRALVVYGKGQLTQRLAQTFMNDWRASGHEIAHEVQFSGDVAELGKLRDQLGTLAADCAFVALEAQQAKLARAYIAPTLPIYATSLVNTGNDAIARLDLNGVAFADMPWLLAADDPAVLAYTHPEPGLLNFELQRFYALGIDAYRIARELLKAQPELDALDGVTGRIALGRGNVLVRHPRAAQFFEGELRLMPDEGAPAPADRSATGARH